MVIETGDRVEFEYVGRLPDGTVFDTSREGVAEESGLAAQQPDREYEPLTVDVGGGRVIEGLEDGLLGLEEGDEKSLRVPPEMAYGESSDDRVEEFDATEFAGMLKGQEPEAGMQVQTQEGSFGEVVHAGPDVVRVDFNHPLADETLKFEVEILDVATS